MSLILFNSWEFGLFFTIVFSLYLILNHKHQNWLLLIASYIFYGWWDWRFLSLLWLSTFIDYFVGLALSSTTSPKIRRFWLLTSLFSNLGILGFFKYFNFFTVSAANLANNLGFEADPVLLNVVLPVGISFYTFQTLSYSIDVYRGRLAAARSLRDFALYVAFFPQLVAGPIERATKLLPQIARPRHVDDRHVYHGLYLISFGLFQKVVLADTLASIADPVFADYSAYHGLDILIALYAFSWQIYGDFAGYSNIARGLAKCLGIDLMVNFNAPYLAVNPREFWQRWHISLSSWLRDYLYIPLGGNRHSRFKTYRNIAITMLLGGLWHGAAWTFVAWGATHAFILIAHRHLISVKSGDSRRLDQSWFKPINHIFKVTLYFHFTVLTWLLFRSSSISQAWQMFLKIFTDPLISPTISQYIPVFLITVTFMLIYNWHQYRFANPGFVLNLSRSGQLAFYTILIYISAYVTLLTDLTYQSREFIYFQF